MARTTDPKQSAAEIRAAGLRVAEELEGIAEDVAPGRSLVDELIAERRAIARAENADYSQRQDDDD